MNSVPTDDRDRRAEVSVHTKLSILECTHRLREAVDEPTWALFSLSGYAGSKPVIGAVNGSEVRLQRRSRLRHPWEALFLDARLVPDRSGTRIQGRFRRRRFQLIFMGVWLTFAVVVGSVLFVFSAIGLAAPSAQVSGNFRVGIVVPLVFWTAAGYYFWRGRRERRFLTTFVREVLGVKE